VKAPRFFCEKCGADVPLQAKKCPQCGRLFEAVRCPSCGFVAEEVLFVQGCPICGYTAPPPPAGKSDSRASGREGKRAASGDLPLWVYLLAALFFIGVCAILLTLLKK
jgi:predicted RNA-binding Zn-ribbon protein involved in translation (DUF1610 family)